MKSTLSNFQTLPLKDAARHLLAKLGYKSDKFIAGAGSSPQSFLDLFGSDHPFDQAKALFHEWKTADLLFQLTDEELSQQSNLFKNDSVQAGLLKSYVFIAIELKGSDYARGKFSSIARQINRLFPMPVMVFFRHQGRLTIAVINRRRNKLDESKDVLGKVTLVSGIDFAQPHRGHLDILDSLAMHNLVHPQKKPINDFDTLHATWEQIFNVELLNERFYRELANWYFWALPQVEFPADLEKDEEKRNATGLIRLLTRIIFCWFLKEKNLISEKLFHPTDLADILKGFDPESETTSTYYHAILQNLFFATLNQRMGKDAKGQPYRTFAKDEGFLKNKATYDVNNLYRYESLFHDSAEDALAHFADIPFLNGGLFECLDRTEDGTDKKRYLDGFSRNAKKRPVVPDRLFFDGGETADLSDVYGDKKRKAEKVTGLIQILNRYKFTIVENTPIDQEIALDPELLGKVFENLLASYNEETKTTARKQTGSFYTPRPIVDYMVDESLKAYLSRVLVEKARMKELDARTGLDLLFTYTEKEHPFSRAEVAILITAIDEVKILDPACGSGAFPMGALHKLVYILGKLDPDNEGWKNTQLAKLDSAPMREMLEATFADNNDDYGRKLYLIENCLYGVDIQPIAIQITKLRFFISLICDQKTNRNKKDNLGIRPLPNLETKFVAANTLIGLKEFGQMSLAPQRSYDIEKEIEILYHNHFSEQRRDRKLANQRKINSLRKELAKVLSESLMAPKKAQHIADWDPFDPHSSADFFDPHWMFGRTLVDGFDVVIGNPPWGAELKESDRKLFSKRYPLVASKTKDSYLFFICCSIDLLKDKGALALIVPNTWLLINSAKDFRKHLLSYAVTEIIEHGDGLFAQATVESAILILTKSMANSGQCRAVRYRQGSKVIDHMVDKSAWLSDSYCRIIVDLVPATSILLEKLKADSDPFEKNCVIVWGIKPYQVGYGNPPQTREMVDKRIYHADSKKGKDWKPLLVGSNVNRYQCQFPGNLFIKYGSGLMYASNERLMVGPKILMRQTSDVLRCCFDDQGYYCQNSVFIIHSESLNLHFLLGLLNSRLLGFVYTCANPQVGKVFAEVKPSAIKGLPIKRINSTATSLLHDRIVKLVSRIIDGRKKNVEMDTTALEREIDQQVYALYDLKPEEIAIVEGTAKMKSQRAP